ncbi:MAG: ferritin family protein [Desulfocapsaceae bacterium]|jgi:rubrerythrin|nr:ferritin family protein [Desulfocapsaceae bacterium]
MFTIADIRDIAIQIEENGEKAYRQASQEAADPEIAEMFAWMADEEKRHARWFATIESDKTLSEEQQALEEMGRGLLKEMIADQTFSMEHQELLAVKTFQEMVVQSKSFEQDTILFYQFIKGVLDDEDACRQIDLIIAEEKRHIERLAELEEAGDGLFASV